MVRVMKMGIRIYGIDESQIKGDFWEVVQDYVDSGKPVIIAKTKEEAQEFCSGEIKWVSDDDEEDVED